MTTECYWHRKYSNAKLNDDLYCYSVVRCTNKTKPPPSCPPPQKKKIPWLLEKKNFRKKQPNHAVCYAQTRGVAICKEKESSPVSNFIANADCYVHLRQPNSDINDISLLPIHASDVLIAVVSSRRLGSPAVRVRSLVGLSKHAKMLLKNSLPTRWQWQWSLKNNETWVTWTKW